MPQDLEERFRAPVGPFVLADRDPHDDGGLRKQDASDLLDRDVKRLRDLQERLYAQGRWALLIILQGMDTAGKDGVIEHVMSGINPQGCVVTSFKAPSATELRHDFLWRCTGALPERGRFGIFNRSYYEDVLVVRIHQDLLEKQHLPPECVTDAIWDERFESIRTFERHLVRNGTLVLKFFLHLSREEQKERLLSRIDQPDKNWKFELGDLAERAHWDDYQRAYEAAIAGTHSLEAPWYIVPADRKWLARLAVAQIIAKRLAAINPQVPTVDAQMRNALKEARKQLTQDGA